MSAKCKICKKSVYPMDPQINLDGSIFHKPCAKCADCNCQITISNFCKNESADQTILLCKTHYFKRFHEGGSYLGGEKFAKAAPRDSNKSDAAAAPVKATVTTDYVASSASKPAAEPEPVRTVFKKLSVKEVDAEPAAAAPAPAVVPSPAKAAPEPAVEEAAAAVEESPVVEEAAAAAAAADEEEPAAPAESEAESETPVAEETVAEETVSAAVAVGDEY